jgi:hypothetical protein
MTDSFLVRAGGREDGGATVAPPGAFSLSLNQHFEVRARV